MTRGGGYQHDWVWVKVHRDAPAYPDPKQRQQRLGGAEGRRSKSIPQGGRCSTPSPDGRREKQIFLCTPNRKQ